MTTKQFSTRFFRAALSSARIFTRARSGATAIIFALTLIPLTLAAGTAIDLGRAYMVKARLNYAIDAAALAVGASGESDQAVMQEIMLAYFEANYPEHALGVPATPQMAVTLSEVRITATADVNTTLMNIVGIDMLTVAAATTVVRETTNLEVALVLDITGSMSGQRIVALRSAASQLVDIVIQDVQEPFYTKAALIPWSMGVNVGSLATQVRGTISSGTCQTGPSNPGGCQNYRFYNASTLGQLGLQTTTLGISTCVSERTHAATRYTDAPPNVAPVGRNYASSSNPCPSVQIVPLTSDRNLLKTRISQLQAQGSTAAQIGIAWGWYLLSPNWGYLFSGEAVPAPYDTEKLLKVAVIMTDGQLNSAYCNGVIAKDSLTGSGSTSNKINCNATNGSTFNQALQLCSAMKNAGIMIYTVGLYLSNDASAQNMVNNCASSPGHVYFPESGVELEEAFRAIGREISLLRIAK